jgi:hypothetical protein
MGGLVEGTEEIAMVQWWPIGNVDQVDLYRVLREKWCDTDEIAGHG